jgi:hypothetical protein
VAGPSGAALDLAGGRIYWANSGNKISFARLDGSGGGDLNTTGATVKTPGGAALDLAAGRIYWANNNGDKISFANLDGSGGGDLTTTGATVEEPYGVAVDPERGRIYWANYRLSRISFARLDGSGGGDLPITPASAAARASYPVLLDRPTGAAAPEINGGSVPGAVLRCSKGAWAPDILASHLYRAPQRFAFQWTRNGAALAGATSSSLPADAPGDYACRVTATNAAGSASQTSAPHSVTVPAGPTGTPPAFGRRTLVTLRLVQRRIPAKGPLTVRVTNANAFEISGELAGETVGKISAVSRRRPSKLKAKPFRVAPNASRTVALSLPKPLRQQLSKGKLKLRLTANLRDPARTTRTVTKTITPRLARPRR